MYSHNFVSESETIIWMATAEFIAIISICSVIILFCIVLIRILLWKDKKAKETTKKEINDDTQFNERYTKEEEQARLNYYQQKMEKAKEIQTAPFVKDRYNITRTPD